jgi:hypothetical protein
MAATRPGPPKCKGLKLLVLESPPACRIATEGDVNGGKKVLYFPQLFEESR